MTGKELTGFCRMISFGFLIFWPFFTFLFTFREHEAYTFSIFIFSILLILCCIINLILLISNRFVLKVFYFGITLIIYLFCVNFYLLSANLLMPVMVITKTLLFLNIFIIEITLLVKRLVFRSSTYIIALKEKRHIKYVVNDFIIAFVIELIIIIIAKMLDINSLHLNLTKFNTIFRIMFGCILLDIGAVAYATGVSFYFYEAKNRTING